MHGGRKGVIGALRHIDVVVRVQELFFRDRVAAVSDDLVDIHVALRARARLPYDQRKFVGQLAVEDLVACGTDRGAFFLGHLLGLQLTVRLCRRFLQ